MSGVVKGIYLQVAGSGVCFPSEKTGCAESVRTQTRKASCVTGESRSDSGVGVGSQCAARTCMLWGEIEIRDRLAQVYSACKSGVHSCRWKYVLVKCAS